MSVNALTAKPRANGTAWLLIAAHVFVLIAMGLQLQFVIKTTGGTLFLAASVAPALVGLAVALTVLALILRFRKAHTLFTVEVFEPGRIIFRQGEPGDCAYFIQAGEVEVIREENGRETVIGTCSEGEYFGEMALLSGAPRNSTVRAKKTTVAGLMGRQNFLAMLSVMPGTHDDVMKTVQERAKRFAASRGFGN
jgi:hypothetical protein